MKIVSSIEEIRKEISRLKKSNKTIGFVPTMGALHDGHLSLVKLSREKSDFTVMSIFINEIQFNDKSDFSKYPRETERDIAKADSAGVDLIFMPSASEMYKDNLTSINVEKITSTLCGKHRPGHFQGVFTVVAKLFNIVTPDIAVFGQKDIQQAVSIKKMCCDLNFPVNIMLAPILRETDGLAMSSRNVHLSTQERKEAKILNKLLKTAESLVESGETKPGTIIAQLKEKAAQKAPEIKFEYISIVNYNTLQNIDVLDDKSVLALAAYAGKTRLIDNMIIKMGASPKCIY
jgi:pantoate--beta-alanine ligase